MSMESIKVKELMVPIEQYALVSRGQSIYEAVSVLENAHKKSDRRRFKHRAILVADRNGSIVGKINEWDILRALEPKYEKVTEIATLSRFGLSSHYIKSMQKDYGLWEEPLHHLCGKANKTRVDDIMRPIRDSQCIDADASLDEAIHQLYMGHYQMLLVKESQKPVGVLRLVDVVTEVCLMIRSCPVP